MQLKNKTTLITGSTSGIGLGIAEHFAKNGSNIMINGFGDKNKITKIKNDIEKKYSIKASYSAADMRNPNEIKKLVDETVEQLGSIDILINNAGIQHIEPIDSFNEQKWDDIIAINLSSAFHTSKYAAKIMKQNNWGRIINIASVHGLIASKYKSAYVAAKHGLIGLTKVVAQDLAEFGVTCNAICPSYVDTELVRKQIPLQAKEHGMNEKEVIEKIFLKDHFIKEFINIEDIAKFALFLCSENAKTITGSEMKIDAGWTSH